MDTIEIGEPLLTLTSPAGKVEVKEILTGSWTLYSVDKEVLILHSKLGIQAATVLCLWEDIREDVKVTRDENDKVIGVAVRNGWLRNLQR